jgi:hypothetical protein
MIFSKLFGGVIEEKREVSICNYIPLISYGITKALDPENHILGLIYNTGEYQIFGTGHIVEMESKEKALERELLEEFNLKIIDKKFIIYFNHQIHASYSINIKNCKIEIPKNEECTLKDTSSKIMFCIHGNVNDILTYMEKIENTRNNDNIIGVWSAPVKLMVDFLGKITKQGTSYPNGISILKV